MTPNVLKQKLPRIIPPGFPFECGGGWRELLEAFFTVVDEQLPPDTRMLRWADVYGRARLPRGKVWVLKQVKEKFGTLRVYYDVGGVGDDVRTAIMQAYNLAEARSHHTCEQCGRRGWMRNDRGWYFVACDRHARSKDDDSVVPRDEGLRWMSVRAYRDGGDDEWQTYDPDTDRIIPCPPTGRNR